MTDKQTHWYEPHVYMDKREMILAACGLRVSFRREIDLKDPSCERCRKRFEEYIQIVDDIEGR